MIRLLIVLIIVALLITTVSRMYGLQRYKAPPETATPIESSEDAPLDPYARARKFGEEDYEKALDEQRGRLDEEIDGG